MILLEFRAFRPKEDRTSTWDESDLKTGVFYLAALRFELTIIYGLNEFPLGLISLWKSEVWQFGNLRLAFHWPFPVHSRAVRHHFRWIGFPHTRETLEPSGGPLVQHYVRFWTLQLCHLLNESKKEIFIKPSLIKSKIYLLHYSLERSGTLQSSLENATRILWDTRPFSISYLDLPSSSKSLLRIYFDWGFFATTLLKSSLRVKGSTWIIMINFSFCLVVFIWFIFLKNLT